MNKAFTVVFLCLGLSAAAGARDVNFTGDFESGRIQANGSSRDGFFVHTLPNPQSGSSDVSSTSGGFGPDSRTDTRVVKYENVGLQTIRPRKGNHFVRSALYYSKDYTKLNGGKNKPRSKLYMNHSNNAVNFDEEGYLGFSMFLPKNWEHERGAYGNPGEAQLLQVQSNGASSTLVHLGVYVPKGKSVAHWILAHFPTATSVRSGAKRVYDLGPVTGDLGKWTDFVMRYRFNPFSKRTRASTISGGMDKIFEGNKGILQLWKSNGSVDGGGNRKMALTSVNIVNKPVGIVPDARKKIDWHFRVYKYGWHKNRTTVKGPVWVGFDEIRDGRVHADNTGYSDVHPGGLACTSGCSTTGSASQILPPSDLVIVN
ncbi:MAG: hypothetical protein WD795_05405 [Woeseia sp.]